MKIANTSTRLYHVLGFEHGEPTNFKLSLADLLTEKDDNPESIMCLQESDQIDEILDLRVDESIYVYIQRDSNSGPNNCKGVLIRLE